MHTGVIMASNLVDSQVKVTLQTCGYVARKLFKAQLLYSFNYYWPAVINFIAIYLYSKKLSDAAFDVRVVKVLVRIPVFLTE